MKVTTGFESIDHLLLGGFSKGELTIIASRPCIGKTSFVLSIINRLLKAKVTVSFFSLEMSMRILKPKLYCLIEGRMYMDFIKDCNFENIVNEYFDQISYFHADDTPVLQMNELENKIIDQIRCNSQIIFIDYFQLLYADEDMSANKMEEIRVITKELKRISTRYNIPIVVTAELFRATKSSGKCPLLNAYDTKLCIDTTIADNIIFIHRPEYYHELYDSFGNDLNGIATIILAKSNSRNYGSVNIRFNKELWQFYD